MSQGHEYEGVVRGGPLDRQKVCNHTSKGFVLVDLEKSLVWVHDYNKQTFFSDEFIARDAEPLDPEKLEKAQEDGGRAVRVLGEEDG